MSNPYFTCCFVAGEVATAKAAASCNTIMVLKIWIWVHTYQLVLAHWIILYCRFYPSHLLALWRRLLPAAMLFGSFNYMYWIFLDLLLFQSFVVILSLYVILFGRNTPKFGNPLWIGIQEARYSSCVGAESWEKWIQGSCPDCWYSQTWSKGVWHKEQVKYHLFHFPSVCAHNVYNCLQSLA